MVGFVLVAITTAAVLIGDYTNNQAQINDPDLLAVVGNEKITKEDLNKRLEFVTGSKDILNKETEETKSLKKAELNYLIEEKVVNLKAEELNITVTDSQALSELTKVNKNFNNFTEEYKSLALAEIKVSLLKTAITNTVVGTIEGDYILFRFMRYLEVPVANGGSVEGKTQIDTEKYNAEKDYATALANKVIADIRAGKISFTEAQRIVLNDPRIGYNNYPKAYLYPIGKFDAENVAGNSLFFNEPVFNEARKKAETGKLSDLLTVKQYTKTSASSAATTEGNDAYHVLFMTTKKLGGNYKDYEEWLSKAKNNLGLEVYYEKL